MRDRKWRSTVSRAYYAVYALVTGTLIENGLTPRAEFGTWSHDRLPYMAGTHLLTGMHLMYALRRLYAMRLLADYSPRVQVGNKTAFECMSLMLSVFRLVTQETRK